MLSFCKVGLKFNLAALVAITTATSLLFVAPGSTSAETLNSNQTTLITSEEVGAFDGEGSTKWEQQEGSYILADQLDQTWRQDIQDSADPDSTVSIQAAQVDPDSLDPLKFKFNNPGSAIDPELTVTAELRDMINIEDQNDLGELANTQPEPDIGTSGSGANTYDKNTLQDLAPVPARFKDQYYINEQKAGARTSRNAILFSFSEPLQAFGVFLGDVETRTDGFGTPALVRLFDSSNNFLKEEQIQPNHPSTSGSSDQSSCATPNSGSAWVNITGCGHNTTRYIGFISPINLISKMLIIVGDDDNYGGTSDDGNTEHLSFIGPTVAFFSPKLMETEPPGDLKPGSPTVPIEAPENLVTTLSSAKLNPTQLAATSSVSARIPRISSGELAETGSNPQPLVLLALSLILIGGSSSVLLAVIKIDIRLSICYNPAHI